MSLLVSESTLNALSAMAGASFRTMPPVSSEERRLLWLLFLDLSLRACLLSSDLEDCRLSLLLDSDLPPFLPLEGR